MDSLALALAFYRQPFGHTELLDPAMPLPRGMDELLLLALDARLPEHTPPSDIEESRLAARFFVQQVFFVRDASHYRVLGLNPDASDAEIKHHHRLLMRLFHPDRRLINEAWADSYAQRINEAYTVLRRANQRHRYDLSLQLAQARRQELAASGMDAAEVVSRHHGQRVVGFPIPRSLWLPGWMLRRLPETVLGVVALVALLSVGGVYLSQRQVPVLASSPVDEASAYPPVAAEASPPLQALALPMSLTAKPGQPQRLDDGVPGLPATPVTPATPTLPEALVARMEPAAVAEVPVPAARPVGEERSTPVAMAADGAGASAPPVPRARPAPPPETVQVATASPPASGGDASVSRLDLEVLTSLFIGAYERGDIDALMALFAEQVETNNQVGKPGIRQDYQTLFGATRHRTMNLTGMRWQRRGSLAQGHGIFEIRLEGTAQTRSYAGTLRLQVEKQNNELLITGFFHRDLYYKVE